MLLRFYWKCVEINHIENDLSMIASLLIHDWKFPFIQVFFHILHKHSYFFIKAILYLC